MDSQFALITGGTTGIGWELANLFARDGQALILVARNKERLEARKATLMDKYSIQVKILAMDLSKCGSGKHLYQQVKERGWEVHTLINNAGFGLTGPFLTTPLEEEQQMVHLNVLTLMELCKLFAGDFKARGGGKIMNVASVVAYLPGPFMSVYYASKAFVLSFTEALHYELKPFGIGVTALVPGATRTEFQQRSGINQTRIMRYVTMMDAATVARAGYRGLKKGKRVVIPGMINKLSVFSLKWMPRSWPAKAIGWLQQ